MSPCCSTTFSTFGAASLLNYSHSSQCVQAFLCDFNIPFFLIINDVEHFLNSSFIAGCAGFPLLQGLSLVAAGGDCSPAVVHGPLIEVASLVAEPGL